MHVLPSLRRLLLSSAALFLLYPAVRAEEAPAAPKKITTVEGITEYQLDNGLRLLLFPDSSTPRITVNMTVLVGSRHEGYGETGMAHLLEHMLFKGTPKHPDVPKVLRDHGANFNGTTWVDRTNYFESMNATPENLEFGIRLEADRLVNSYVKREDLASEMTVVRSEFESGENNPEYILMQRMMAAAYEWHNYGKSTIGNRSDIERVPIENLQAFYRKHYQPDNVVLIIAGNFQEKKALELVARYFGALKRPERRLTDTYTEEPPQDGERTVTLRRVGTVGMVGAIYHIPAAAHADYAAVDVLATLLGDEPNGPLYKALVETKKASSVSTNAFGYHDPGALLITVKAENAAELEAVRDRMLEVLADGSKITDEAVERTKRRLLTDWKKHMNDANQVGRTLSEWVAAGDWRLFFLYRDGVAKVTTKDVARVAAQYLARNNRTVGLYIPSQKAERAMVPATPKIEALVANYKGGTAVVEGETFDPTPENIEQRLQHGTLGSGVKMVLLPKKARGNEVNLALTLRFGNEESLKSFKTAAEYLGSMLERGTKKHDWQQLKDELDKLEGRINVSSDVGELSVRVTAKRQNLEATLRLLGEMLREPTFPEKEFEVLKRQNLEQIKSGLTEPQMLAVTLLQRKMAPYPPDNIRYVPTLQESMARNEAVTLDQVRQLYTEQVSGQVGELVAVGDFDPATLRPQIEEILKDWKTSIPYRRIEKPAKTDVKGERHVIATPDKANAVFAAAHTLAMTDSDPDFPALRIADFIFGEAPLASRLSVRVRGKEGLSYGVGSHMEADSLDKSGVFLMFAICNPVNIDKVDKAIAEVLEQMAKEGVTETELTEAKKAYLQSLKLRRSSDGQLATLLAHNLHVGRTFAFYSDLEKKVNELTVEQVSKVFRERVRPERLIIIRAGDFKEEKGNK